MNKRARAFILAREGKANRESLYPWGSLNLIIIYFQGTREERVDKKEKKAPHLVALL